eukprot:TRINITY_DN38723_c0_g1_i1.p1 TRINITY_DN38723_c0_g1~~TRINITY_DN38723_c0_g1_i1.p1  ORF type:complete len:152 (-),score=40.69 TRINITY_DN38723_c0_g1_i1:10-465(-)
MRFHVAFYPGEALPVKAEPSEFVDSKAAGSVGAAAGAGLGGLAVFHTNSKACVAPPGCEKVKECMASAAKKAFLGAAVLGAVGSAAGSGISDSSAPFDEWSIAPAMGLWAKLDEQLHKQQRARAGLDFLCLGESIPRRSSESNSRSLPQSF